MDLAELNRVANVLVTPGKGVLAADKSAGTVKKRFDVIGVECTEDNRRDYRELLFRSTGMANISGVILFDETIRQKAKDGTPLVKIIEAAGTLPGIKVDKGGEAATLLPRRGDHRGAGRARREARRVSRRSARNSPSGARSSISAPASRPMLASMPMPMRSPAMPRSASRGHRADRRAGSADGRRPRHRPVRQRHRVRA